MIEKYYKVLFEPGEGVCLGASIYDTQSEKLKENLEEWLPSLTLAQFICINPLNGRRKDDNVSIYRNILVEFDSISLEEQEQLIKESRLPYSTLVFSGGKSLHAIISLTEPLKTKEEYKALVKRIYEKLGGRRVVDTSTSNPSRFSRTPNVYRDNGAFQKLIDVRERVPNETLLTWLGPEKEYPVKKTERSLKETSQLHPFTKLFLLAGAPEGEWNSSLFKAVCDMVRCGMSEDEIEERCAAVTGHLDSSDKKTIESAIKNARNSAPM